MEKRKAKILSHFDALIEEKITVEENLRKVIDQVFSCVDHIKNPENLKQTKLTEIFKYELDVLKKFAEINYELECMLEESPLTKFGVQEKQYEPEESDLKTEQNRIAPVKSEIPEVANIPIDELNIPTVSPTFFDNPENQVANSSLTISNFPEALNVPETLEVPNSVENERLNTNKHDTACSTFQISNLLSANSTVDAQDHFSDADIQTLRETLRKFSEKVGLTEQSLSSMKDYYEKPSTSYIRDFFKNPSKNPLSSSIAIPEPNPTCNFKRETNSDSFQIPEKDTNTLMDLPPRLKENSIDSHNSSDISTQSPICQPEESSNDDDDDVEIDLMKVIRDNLTFNSKTSTENEHCLTSIPNEVATCSFVDNAIQTKESDSTRAVSEEPKNEGPSSPDPSVTKEPICKPETKNFTALQKLNNYEFREKQLCELTDVEPLNTPDIKLKPTKLTSSSVIRNFDPITDVSNTKKNKKKENELQADTFYELKLRTDPKAGMECAFSHIESPTEFYIHILDEQSTLIDMVTEQINEHFKNTVSEHRTKESAFVAIGRYCFVFVDQYEGWYRGAVLNWNFDNESDMVLIQLVDYGNKLPISYKNLRRVTPAIAKIPILAIRCHFPLMYPPTSTSLNKLSKWPPESIDGIVGLSGLLESDEKQNKLFKLVYAQREGNSVAVDLYNLQDGNDEHTVGQILLDLGLAVQIFNEYDESEADLELFLQDIDSLETADNINEAVMGYDARDEARICRFTKRDGTCFKGKNCKLEHVPLPKDGFTTDAEEVFREAMYSLILPSCGDLVTILITGYVDSCRFFAQLVRTPHQEPKYAIDKELYLLLEDMNSPRNVKTYESHKISPTIGEIVMARHWSKKWLRAVVREVNMGDNGEPDKIQVFTVDFGDYVNVTMKNLRKIRPNFLQLPFQAVECYIHNYKMKTGCPPEKAKEFFNSNLYFHNFAAHIMSVSLPLKVEIQSFNGLLDVGKTLEQKGFAEKRTYDNGPREDCLLELY